jgi:hypothetical protein
MYITKDDIEILDMVYTKSKERPMHIKYSIGGFVDELDIRLINGEVEIVADNDVLQSFNKQSQKDILLMIIEKAMEKNNEK